MRSLNGNNKELRIYVDKNNNIIGSNLLFRVSKMKYLEDLRDGKLYINKLSFFRKYEKEGIGDKEEGLLLYRETAAMSVDEQEDFDIKGLRVYVADNNPVFCFGSVTVKEVSPGIYNCVIDKRVFEDFIEKSDEKYGIMFVFEDAFIELLERRMEELNFGWHWERVIYVDQRPTIKEDEWYKVAFYKRKRFAHQNEMRLLLDMTVDDHYELKIDSLEECSKIFSIPKDRNNAEDLKLTIRLNKSKK